MDLFPERGTVAPGYESGGPTTRFGYRPTNVRVAVELGVGSPRQQASELDDIIGVWAAGLDGRSRPHNAGDGPALPLSQRCRVFRRRLALAPHG
jgi:hypothetical protein